jgi:chromosome partitioning protein
MTDIIGIVQIKGGVGRSTVSTNLSAYLSKNHTTALIDCDIPQGTASSWYALRAAGNKVNNLVIATAKDHKKMVEHIQLLSNRVEYVVLDAPPRIAEITRSMLMLCDLIVIPVGATAAELWATSDLLETISEAKKNRPQLEYRLLWNKYRTSTKSAKYLSGEVELEASTLSTKLGFRVAYGDALANGLSVIEWHDIKAKQEVIGLTNEIITILRG